MIYYFGDQAVPGSFGTRGGPSPYREWPSFAKQIRQEAEKRQIGHHGMTTALHHAIYGDAVQPLVAPAALANNATSALVSQYTINHKLFHNEQDALREIKHAILIIIDDGYHSVITEYDAQGNDLGIMRRTLPAIMDLLDAKFGGSDRQALLEEKEELFVPYSYELHGTYDQFLNKVKKNLAFLQKHNNPLSAFEKYEAVKQQVAGVHFLTEAITVYEYQHPLPADQTFELLTVHLSNVAKANPHKMTGMQAINQVKQVHSAPTNKVNEELCTEVAEEVRRILGSQTLSAVGQARLISVVGREVKRALDPSKPKSCIHHPHSRNHTTAECRNPK